MPVPRDSGKGRPGKQSSQVDGPGNPDCRAEPVDLGRAADCDFIAAQDPDICMSPFPDNYYTLADATTATGRRINFTAAAMPANAGGEKVDPAPYMESDGFSQGQTISVRVPGLDNPAALEMTDPVGLADPAQYLAENAPVIVLNARTRSGSRSGSRSIPKQARPGRPTC